MEPFEFRTEQRASVVRAVCRSSVEGRSTGLLLLTGKLAAQVDLIVDDLLAAALKTEWLIVCAVGVLSNHGEIEGQSGAVGMRLPVRGEIRLGNSGSRDFGESILEAMGTNTGATACVFVRGDHTEDEWLDVVRRSDSSVQARLLGGGALPGTDVRLVGGGEESRAPIATIVWPGRTNSQIAASSACRLLSPVSELTKSEGPVIEEIDGAPALRRLSEATHGLAEGSLVLLAVAAGDQPLDPRGRSLALRPIVGVDPSRETLLLGEPLPPGSRVAFAVRDRHGARTDLEAHLRTIKQNLAGSAPGFGLYISCAGRGRALYESPDVDTRLINRHLPSMPFVGMHSTFEIASLGTRLTPQVYAGVVSVFTLPS